LFEKVFFAYFILLTKISDLFVVFVVDSNAFEKTVIQK